MKGGLLADLKRDRVSYLFLAPFGTLFFLFTVVPVGLSVLLSFTSFNMLQTPNWVGWGNYIRLFLEDEVFLIAVKNTLIFAAITGPVSYILCFILAWFINELQPRLRAILTLLFYAPSISGNAYLIWQLFFSGDMYGYLNGLLLDLGFINQPIQWLVTPKYMMGIVIIVSLWMSLGTSFLAFIAGLQGIDESLYEAGAIDGVKNRWQELWYLTIPQMVPYMMFGAIMSITSSFMAAGQITALVGFPPTDYATWTVVQHITDYGMIRYEMGYASTIAVVLFFFMVGAQRLVQSFLRKIGD